MPTLSGVDEVLKAATDRGDVPGVVAMAASRDGPVYEGAFGRRVLPDGAAMTADTVFWIASMTKAITSTAAMQLVERGKLRSTGRSPNCCRSLRRRRCSKASMRRASRDCAPPSGRSRYVI
jgi:hypothetical protein